MKRKPTDAERQTEIDELLARAHKQSQAAPEWTPFWREGGWRCELHVNDEGLLLKVFNRDTCVYEEATKSGPTASARMLELRRMFVSGTKRTVD